MKKFKDLQIGDKVFKIFFKLKSIDGLGNVCRITKVTAINPDIVDPHLLNIFTKEHSFDIDECDFERHCIVYDTCGFIEINSTSILLGVFQFIFRLVPCYILLLLNKIR